MNPIKASIITIGDELLIGQTIDTNSAWMAQQLNLIGIDVVKRVAVGDNKKDIVDALNDAIETTTIVLITGGLGPTADDITKPLLCDYFGGQLVMNAKVEQQIKSIFEARNLPMLTRNLKQAEVPDNCEVLFNSRGTAPGMLFKKNNVIIISMPGVPNEMMGIMSDHVLPQLSKQFISEPIVHRSIFTAGIGESFLAEKIESIEQQLPEHIKLAYLPNNRTVKLRLTGKGKKEQALIAEVEHYVGLIAERIQEYVVVLDDLPLEQVLASVLKQKHQTIGIAESCTGGNIGHKLTQIPGATQFFRGSIVCYNEDIKSDLVGVSPSTIQEFGVVSSEVAEALAIGAKTKLKADFGLGITGILGPAMDDKLPVGTVWIGVSDGTITQSKKFHFTYDRNKNKEIATDMALLTIWKFIEGKW